MRSLSRKSSRDFIVRLLLLSDDDYLAQRIFESTSQGDGRQWCAVLSSEPPALVTRTQKDVITVSAPVSWVLANRVRK